MSIAIVSGYFNQLHKGHLELIRKAKKYGKVLVIVNNNTQTLLKSNKIFMDDIERAEIMYNLTDVFMVEISIDTDRTVNRTLRFIRACCPNEELFFVNGLEYKTSKEDITCKKLGIKLKYEGKKIQSSSWLLKK